MRLVAALQGGDYTSIQAAVDAASAGDLIVVKPGVYRERVVVHRHGLHILTEEGAVLTGSGCAKDRYPDGTEKGTFLSATLLMLGSLPVSGGVVSMLTLMGKGVLCLMASFLLMASTPIDALCAALRRLHVPKMIVTLLLLTYRYVGVMTEELAVMTDAYHLRAPGQKGIHVSAWGSFLGQLLLRSMDRAQELYASMLLRGYHEHFHYADIPRFSLRDGLYTLGCTAVFLLLRFVPLAQAAGSLFVR